MLKNFFNKPNKRNDFKQPDKVPKEDCLSLIKDNPEAWNELRFKNSHWIPNLDGANFENVNLFDVNLKNCSLIKANFSKSINLHQKNIGGSNLDGAIMPEGFEFSGLSTIKELSTSSSTIFIAIMLFCFYCWLTILSTNDFYLLTNSSNSTLPILNVSLDIIGFYISAPLMLLAFYIYFHLNLKKLWYEFSELPAYFPDGKSIEQKSYSWLINDFSIYHMKLIKKENPLFLMSKHVLIVLLTWGIVPITMFGIWAKYLINHGMILSSAHSIELSLCIVIGFLFFQNARKDLQGRNICNKYYKSTNIKCIFSLIVLSLILILLSSANANSPFSYSYHFNNKEIVKKPQSWFYREAEVQKLDLNAENYLENFNDLLAAIKPVDLENKNLINFHAQNSFLVKANFSNSNLKYANLGGSLLLGTCFKNANLQKAYLRYANFQGADLSYVNAEGTGFIDVNLKGADFSNSNLKKAHFEDASFQNTSFEKAYLEEAEFESGDLKRTDFSYAEAKNSYMTSIDLRGSNFTGANFQQAGLSNSNLQDTTFQYASLKGAYLDDADLKNSVLLGANLQDAKLYNADLRYANLNSCNLQGANVDAANFKKASLCLTNLQGVDLSKAKGLTYKQLSKAFIDKNTKLPENLVKHQEELMKPHTITIDAFDCK